MAQTPLVDRRHRTVLETNQNRWRSIHLHGMKSDLATSDDLQIRFRDGWIKLANNCKVFHKLPTIFFFLWILLDFRRPDSSGWSKIRQQFQFTSFTIDFFFFFYFLFLFTFTFIFFPFFKIKIKKKRERKV